MDDLNGADSDEREEVRLPLGSQIVPGVDAEEFDIDESLDRDDGDAVLEEGRRLLEEAEAKLASVERALSRLDAGSYGLCEICNEQIPPQLLTERPSLSRCPAHESANS